MGNRVLFLVIVLSVVAVSRPSRASSVAARHRPRCSQTSGASFERLIGRQGTSDELIADASHLLPHLEIGYVPFGVRTSEFIPELRNFHHMTLALKPSLSLCRVEAHLTAETTFGDDESQEERFTKLKSRSMSFGWRIGAELFTRPSRWFPDSLRLFDSIGIGFGATFGGILTNRNPMIEVDKTLEFGPRLLFDVNEWLAFVVAVNVHFRPVLSHGLSEFGLVTHGAVQLSFPSHALFGGTHEHH